MLWKLPNGVNCEAWPDCRVSSALIYAAFPEYRELNFVRRHLYRDHVILDVGANVGHISMLLADIVGPDRIFGFEPTPIAFERMMRNWRINGWNTGNLLNVAVGAARGEVYVPATRSPVTTNQVTSNRCRNDEVPVPLLALDNILEKFAGLPVGLLKIDVEGYEPEVFRRSGILLSEVRPRLVMFESRSNTIDPVVCALLNAASYDVFELNASGKPDCNSSTAQNLFAIPRELRPTL